MQSNQKTPIAEDMLTTMIDRSSSIVEARVLAFEEAFSEEEGIEEQSVRLEVLHSLKGPLKGREELFIVLKRNSYLKDDSDNFIEQPLKIQEGKAYVFFFENTNQDASGWYAKLLDPWIAIQANDPYFIKAIKDRLA